MNDINNKFINKYNHYTVKQEFVLRSKSWEDYHNNFLQTKIPSFKDNSWAEYKLFCLNTIIEDILRELIANFSDMGAFDAGRMPQYLKDNITGNTKKIDKHYLVNNKYTLEKLMKFTKYLKYEWEKKAGDLKSKLEAYKELRNDFIHNMYSTQKPMIEQIVEDGLSAGMAVLEELDYVNKEIYLRKEKNGK